MISGSSAPVWLGNGEWFVRGEISQDFRST